MERARTPATSPARHCDDIVELIDAILAECGTPALMVRPGAERLALVGSR